MKLFNKTRFAALGMAIAWAVSASATLAAGATVVAGQKYAVGSHVYVGPGVGYIYVGADSYLANDTAAVNNSTLVTERRVATVASEAQANMILNQISDRLDRGTTQTGSSVSLLPQSGGNAGSHSHQGSFWARAGIDNMRESITGASWDANLWSFAIGYDHKINDKVLAGLALTYSNLNGSTKFNKGSIKDNAYGLLPYVAFRVHPCFDVDFMGGYSRVNKSRDRITPTTASVNGGLTGPRVTSSPNSDRYFGALHGNYRTHVNRWNLLARLGYLYVSDRQKAFNESAGGNQYTALTTNVSRASLRLQAGYKASSMVEPYAFLTYARDFGASKMKLSDGLATTQASSIGGISYVGPNSQRSNDTYGGGLGLNANLPNNWSTGLEGTYSQSKKFKVIGGMLRARMVF